MLKFCRVNESNKHCKILYELLEKRIYGISHTSLPQYSEHEAFVRSKPYLHWYIVFSDEPVGAFYVKDDNSVGLNLLSNSVEWVSQIFQYIESNIKPSKSVPSLVPPYFYTNVAVMNEDLIEIFKQLGIGPIQISYKITGKGDNTVVQSQ